MRMKMLMHACTQYPLSLIIKTIIFNHTRIYRFKLIYWLSIIYWSIPGHPFFNAMWINYHACVNIPKLIEWLAFIDCFLSSHTFSLLTWVFYVLLGGFNGYSLALIIYSFSLFIYSWVFLIFARLQLPIIIHLSHYRHTQTVTLWVHWRASPW